MATITHNLNSTYRDVAQMVREDDGMPKQNRRKNQRKQVKTRLTAIRNSRMADIDMDEFDAELFNV